MAEQDLQPSVSRPQPFSCPPVDTENLSTEVATTSASVQYIKTVPRSTPGLLPSSALHSSQSRRLSASRRERCASENAQRRELDHSLTKANVEACTARADEQEQEKFTHSASYQTYAVELELKPASARKAYRVQTWMEAVQEAALAPHNPAPPAKDEGRVWNIYEFMRPAKVGTEAEAAAFAAAAAATKIRRKYPSPQRLPAIGNDAVFRGPRFPRPDSPFRSTSVWYDDPLPPLPSHFMLRDMCDGDHRRWIDLWRRHVSGLEKKLPEPLQFVSREWSEQAMLLTKGEVFIEPAETVGLKGDEEVYWY